MDRKIKLIWDFRGPDASQIAQHHARHLGEFSVIEDLPYKVTGHLDYSSAHSIAFLVVPESRMHPIRDALKPHRGEVYQD